MWERLALKIWKVLRAQRRLNQPSVSARVVGTERERLSRGGAIMLLLLERILGLVPARLVRSTHLLTILLTLI